MAVVQKLLHSKLGVSITNRCLLSTGHSMNAWMCEEYGKPLIKRQTAIPIIRNQSDVLVKVEAASINPIDVRMSEGYAHEAMTALHRIEERDFTASKPYYRLPLIGGRDFCGEIGSAVRDFKTGDQVIGVVPAWWQGSHAEYVLSTTDCVALKPKTVDSVNAVAMCYTLATVWSALKMACVPVRNAQNLRVLIHGGSGGIGTTLIQLLREWNAQKIVATCSENNLQFVRNIGAIPIDYNAHNAREQLQKEGPFELILDCAKSPANRMV
ncbi:PKS-ER domain-containing protein [Aphelenchoides bicaudatus]|nr:PKS-ER domain-containing protein [Aphelenchoides bicaudatus]